VRVGFEFAGKAAHAAADPWEGVNALDAVIQTFNNVSMLRQQIRPQARVHGIVTQGGVAPNIIPEAAACTLYVREAQLDRMWDLRRRVVACAEGAAQATGCTLTVVDFEAPYEPLKRNDTLLELFRANMKTTGAVESPPIPDRLGSSDIGNVSHVVPAIQPMVQIAPPGTPIHSRAFEAAAVSPLARQGMCQAATAMALTTYDLLADPGLIKRARSEFEAAR
jgi:metal-dependent amidase/aminoacylase/carboxypeptidase family protein